MAPKGQVCRVLGTDEQLSGGVPEGRPSSANQQQRAEKAPATVEPGKLGEMNVSDLKIAPHRFQYKLGTDAEGVGTLLKEQKVFNPDLAGVVSVWRDPADGKMYVVNGHHRVKSPSDAVPLFCGASASSSPGSTGSDTTGAACSTLLRVET